VLPRDGLQVLKAEAQIPSTAQKLDLIGQLVAVGLRHIEVTSFARPDLLPQFADAEDVARRLPRVEGVEYQALVPNLRGAQRAVDSGIRKLSCLIVASQTYQLKNSNMSVEQGLEQIDAICSFARSAGAVATATVGTSFWCPYEGLMPEAKVMALVERLVSFGIRLVVLADSIGCADPLHIRRLVVALRVRFPELSIGLHLHDFTGLGLTNAYAGWDVGVDVFETSAAGIGGGIRMPVAAAQMGNVATEDIVHLLHRCGVPTGIDLDRLRDVGQWAAQLLQQSPASRLCRGGTLEQFLASGQAVLDR
jgi:hydroxymethylglutaryl-CoA lyase